MKGKQSIDRWLKYNMSTTLEGARSAGATGADISYDIRRGLLLPQDPNFDFKSWSQAGQEPPATSTARDTRGSVERIDVDITQYDVHSGSEEEAEVHLAETGLLGEPLVPSIGSQSRRARLEHVIDEMAMRHEQGHTERGEDLLESAQYEVAAAAYQ